MADYVNASKRPPRSMDFNLGHDIYCEAADKCACSEVKGKTRGLHPTTGDVQWTVGKRLVASSLMAPHGETVSLTKAHLAVPEIQAAVDRGDLKKVEAPKAAQAKPKPTSGGKNKSPKRGEDS